MIWGLLRGLVWGVTTASTVLVWEAYRRQQKEVHLAQGQTHALKHIVNALSKESDLNVFLGHVLRAIADQLEAAWVGLFFHDPEQDLLSPYLVLDGDHLLSGESLRQSTPPPIAASAVAVWQEMCHTHRPIFIDDIAHDSRLRNREQLLSLGVRTLLAVPLVSGSSVLGWFSLRSLSERRYEVAELELASALAQQTVLAVQLARLAERSQQAAILAERNRMAREIHDTLAQGFTGINWQLEATESALLNGDLNLALQRLRQASILSKESLAEARRSVRALRPAVLEQKNFAAALRDSVYALTADTDLRVDVQVDSLLPSLPVELEADLLRIAQEAITNVIKHAHASVLTVEMKIENNCATLHVADDGQGFRSVVERVDDGSGFGLTAMRERATRHGGNLTIHSRPDQGTQVITVVPFSVVQ